jgi:hypothetical protein
MRLPSDARGTVAVILASAVGLSVVTMAAGTAWAIVDKGLTVPTEVSSLMSTALGALIGAVATYLGLRVMPPDEQTPPPEPKKPDDVQP